MGIAKWARRLNQWRMPGKWQQPDNLNPIHLPIWAISWARLNPGLPLPSRHRP
jgi:hypothetical protein